MPFDQIEEDEISDEILDAAAMKEGAGAWAFVCTTGLQCNDVFE